MIDSHKAWDMVSDAWDNDAPECGNCEYFESEYYTDTGYQTWCRLLQNGGNPAYCAAFARMEEERDDG